MSARDDSPASSANLTEKDLADLQSIELDLGPGPAAPSPPPPSPGAAGLGPDPFAAPLPGSGSAHGGGAAPPAGLGPDPFALGPEPYAVPPASPSKPSVRDLANRVAEGGARAAAQLSPMLDDARARTAATTARAVDEAKSRGLVPLGAILVAVGVLVVVVFVVARFVLPDNGVGTSPGSGEPRTKHVAESAGATPE